jgi:hypothetical protein
MNIIQTIDEHILIRETCGYETISKVDVFDIPQVLKFLKICHNYTKMQNIENGK